MVRGVHQDSILGSLSFKLFVNDLFCFIEITHICHFYIIHFHKYVKINKTMNYGLKMNFPFYL